MINTYKYKNVTWVDIECPTREDARLLMQKYDIHPVAAEELILPTTRSKVDQYPGFIYMILHFPAWKHSHRETTQEIDFIIGKNYLITARYDSIDPIHKFAKMFEVNSVLKHNDLLGEHAGYMLYYMLREIYHSLADELESVKDALEDVEQKTFGGDEQAMVFEISKISRELLSFKHSTSLHREVLDSFAPMAVRFFGSDFAHHMEATQSEYLKVSKQEQALFDSLHELRATNDSLLSTKQNKNIMTLTVIAFITSILGMFIGIFEINFKDAPIIGMPHDFWIMVTIVVSIGLFFTALFAHKKWL